MRRAVGQRPAFIAGRHGDWIPAVLAMVRRYVPGPVESAVEAADQYQIGAGDRCERRRRSTAASTPDVLPKNSTVRRPQPNPRPEVAGICHLADVYANSITSGWR